jgi:hypothetical protein
MLFAFPLSRFPLTLFPSVLVAAGEAMIKLWALRQLKQGNNPKDVRGETPGQF